MIAAIYVIIYRKELQSFVVSPCSILSKLIIIFPYNWVFFLYKMMKKWWHKTVPNDEILAITKTLGFA